jgi:hypothetical protein
LSFRFVVFIKTQFTVNITAITLSHYFFYRLIIKMATNPSFSSFLQGGVVPLLVVLPPKSRGSLLGSLVGPNTQAASGLAFTALRKLESVLHDKDEGDVDGFLVDMMEMIGGESSYFAGAGDGGAGVAGGCPKVEFDAVDGPAREGCPACWIRVADAAAF